MRSTETSLRVSFETYLRRRLGGQKDVATTLSRRPRAEWVRVVYFSKSLLILSKNCISEVVIWANRIFFYF